MFQSNEPSSSTAPRACIDTTAGAVTVHGIYTLLHRCSVVDRSNPLHGSPGKVTLQYRKLV